MSDETYALSDLPRDIEEAVVRHVREAERIATHTLSAVECRHLSMTVARESNGYTLSYWNFNGTTSLDIRVDEVLDIPEDLYCEWYGSGQRHVRVVVDSDHFDEVAFIQYQRKEDS